MAREIEELMAAVQMLEVTDKKIQKWSDGEVTWPGKQIGDKDFAQDLHYHAERSDEKIYPIRFNIFKPSLHISKSFPRSSERLSDILIM